VIIGAKSPDQLRDNRSTRVRFDDAGDGGDVADARQSARAVNQMAPRDS
jgi:hypothetical protein